MTGTSVADWAARLDGLMAARWAETSDGSHDIGHLRRVWANCQTIAAEEGGADLTVLVAAAYLHDLVNLPKDAPDRATAAAQSAEAACAWLAEDGFDAGLLPAVAHAIAAHSFSAGIAPETAEARILRDADRLDALGAVGIARCFCVAGQTGAGLFHADDPFAATRPLDDRRFALDHFEVKLLRLPEGMLTAGGRRLAEGRVATMRAWLDALRAELAADDTPARPWISSTPAG